ncbi:MAG TPA: chemotaxis protein CheB [Solirubrobacteraceae bacterium]|nr:chemotaxis protein CheB [Solirubrobacteraceae bacterium]
MSAGQSERDLVVIGASAGGVEALRHLVAGLPADLPAAVCVVLHIAPESPSALPAILARAGPLPCRAATDRDELRRGQILVAPPDHHLEIEDGHVRLTVGPRENGHRPSVDVLFRSAAAVAGDKVVGVVLSGSRDDGSAGLATIKVAGGVAVVQDPADALYSSMPRSALAAVDVDVVAPVALIAESVELLVRGRPVPHARVGRRQPDEDLGDDPMTTVCPECGGVLSELAQAGVRQWECRVGHRYSTESFIDAQAEGIEAGLWAAVRALHDRQLLLDRIAARFEAAGEPRSARSFRDRAAHAGRQTELLRETLARAAGTSLRPIGVGGRPGEATG